MLYHVYTIRVQGPLETNMHVAVLQLSTTVTGTIFVNIDKREFQITHIVLRRCQMCFHKLLLIKKCKNKNSFKFKIAAAYQYLQITNTNLTKELKIRLENLVKVYEKWYNNLIQIQIFDSEITEEYRCLQLLQFIQQNRNNIEYIEVLRCYTQQFRFCHSYFKDSNSYI